MRKWTVPRMWQGKTVLLLATGPSLTPLTINLCRAVRRLRADAVAAVAVSDAFRVAPWADMLYSADAAWWHAHAQEALKFEGLKVTVSPSVSNRHVHLLKQGEVEGFAASPDTLATGGNSGYQALHLAVHAGARRALLCGYDMTGKRGAHFFGDHPRNLRTTDEASFGRFAPRFAALAGRGTEIINCSPGSAIECFPRADLGDILETL